MKKIYNRTESLVINMSAETSMMLSVSASNSGSQGDDWSNERQWDGSNEGFDWSQEGDEE